MNIDIKDFTRWYLEKHSTPCGPYSLSAYDKDDWYCSKADILDYMLAEMLEYTKENING